jgi:hypothetical protein
MRSSLQRSEDSSRAQVGDIDLVIWWKHSVAHSEKREGQGGEVPGK